MIRRKPLDDDDEHPDRWLVSYADFITLLFAFFVVMYAISSVNLSKYNALTTSMGNAFTGHEASQQATVKTPPSQQQQPQEKKSVIKPLPLSYLFQERSKREREQMAKMGQDISNKLTPLVESGAIQVSQNGKGVKIDIQDKVLFNSGSADLAPAAVNVISAIADMLKTHQKLIQIEGHTDSTPIHNAVFYSNWELSAVRATAVVRMLVDSGIAPQRLSAVGYSDTQPISSSDTEIGHATNRRVSILILYDIKNEFHNNQDIKPIAP